MVNDKHKRCHHLEHHSRVINYDRTVCIELSITFVNHDLNMSMVQATPKIIITVVNYDYTMFIVQAIG